MLNARSDYALNKKDANAIVYAAADGSLIRLTRGDFASEEEFLKWKAWSDASYHETEKHDHIHDNHTFHLEELSEEALAVPSVDVCLELEEHQLAQMLAVTEKVERIRAALTDTQFRRLWMYFVDGMTIDAIGEEAGISHQNISKSISAAMKKNKKIFP